MTFFNVRIPGVKFWVVAADGQNVRPVEVEEFQIGTAETYDIVVEPNGEAHTIVAESMDRSGMAVATLASRPGARAAVPALRDPPLLTMADMGMAGMAHGAHGAGTGGNMDGIDHGAMGRGAPSSGGMAMRDSGEGLGAEAMAGMDGMSMGGMDMRDTAMIGRASWRERVCQYVEISVATIS